MSAQAPPLSARFARRLSPARGEREKESPPSLGASRHSLPQGEKESQKRGEVSAFLSPLAGESRRAKRAERGGADRLHQFAKSLRTNQTDAEQRLWRQLRAHRFLGEKFRRQQPLGPYIVDFVHFGARMVVEADGGQHCESAEDLARDTWIRAQGFRVLRFWNNEILANTEGVLQEILLALESPPSPGSLRSPPSPARGEGESKAARAPASLSPLAGESGAKRRERGGRAP